MSGVRPDLPDGNRSGIAAEVASWIWLPWLVLAWAWRPVAAPPLPDVIAVDEVQGYDVID